MTNKDLEIGPVSLRGQFLSTENRMAGVQSRSALKFDSDASLDNNSTITKTSPNCVCELKVKRVFA